MAVLHLGSDDMVSTQMMLTLASMGNNYLTPRLCIHVYFRYLLSLAWNSGVQCAIM